MNKEQIQQAAIKFLNSDGMMRLINDHPSEGLLKFLQSMIEKGEFVSAEKYEALSERWYNAAHPKTVPSAGKEVKSMYDCLTEAKFHGDKDDPRLLVAMKDYGEQFKSSHASTEISDGDIETQALKMYKPELGTHNLMVSICKWYREQLKNKL